MASSSMCVTTLSGGEASALPPDSGVAKGAGAASGWVIMASVAVVCATDADLSAGADFSVDLKMPPHITPLKISPRLFPTATVSHHFPEVLAADASGLLLLHADQGPAAGPIFVDLPGRSEAKPSAFLPGYFVLDANNSTSFSIPNAENFMDSDKVGLIPSPDGGPYVVAELQHAIGRSEVTILEYKSVDGTWAEHTFDNPVRDRRLAPHGSFPHNGSIWWVDLSVGLIGWDRLTTMY
uniref:Uncharacterized protein n=1 Tax=Avena sativa TaxID=4498 RepID=A0ACD5X129_AVESA